MTVTNELDLEFNQAIIKLAREYEIDELKLSFDKTINPSETCSEVVEITWQKKRHGRDDYTSGSYSAHSYREKETGVQNG